MKFNPYNIDPRAFPYLPPSLDLIREFNTVFSRSLPIAERSLLRIVDLLISLTVLIISMPLLLLIASAIWVEGRVYPQNAGPILDPYIAASQGRKFLKLKFRTLRFCTGLKATRRVDFRYRLSEHEDRYLTIIGRLLKKWYLDEIPQIVNVIRGETALVGPRPLAWHHYIDTVKQGHPVRSLLKAGLFGPTHVHKGEMTFPDLRFDYAYAELYLRSSSVRLLCDEVLVILRGLRTALKGLGL